MTAKELLASQLRSEARKHREAATLEMLDGVARSLSGCRNPEYQAAGSAYTEMSDVAAKRLVSAVNKQLRYLL